MNNKIRIKTIEEAKAYIENLINDHHQPYHAYEYLKFSTNYKGVKLREVKAFIVANYDVCPKCLDSLFQNKCPSCDFESGDFKGTFKLDRPLELSHLKYLAQFSKVRHMVRDAKITEARTDDSFRLAVGLPVGEQGEFFVGETGNYRTMIIDPLVVDHNLPPKTQPSLWCQWKPHTNGREIIQNKMEKFHHPIEWIEYIIDNFFKPWGYILNGKSIFHTQYERGTIIIKNNVVKIENYKEY